MNHHRGVRIATTLACVGIACLFDHFACPALCGTLFGKILIVLVNIILFSVALWHYRKAWWGTAVLIASLIVLPMKSPAGDGVKPKTFLCIIVGGAILIGGGYASWKIYKCAKKNLNPPPPPTNAPPNNKPGEWAMHTLSDSAMIPWTNLMALECAVDDSVWSSNWVDWQGNPIAYCFAGETNLMQVSTNLRTWIPMTVTVTGWVSQVNGVDSNGISIMYHNGKPFETNWHRIDSTGTNAMLLDTLGIGFPVERVGSRFYKRPAQGAASQ